MSTHACERCEIDHPWRECEPWPEETKGQMKTIAELEAQPPAQTETEPQPEPQPKLDAKWALGLLQELFRDRIAIQQKVLAFIKQNEDLLHKLPPVNPYYVNSIDFDNLSHADIIRVILAFPGEWQKNLSAVGNRIDYSLKMEDGIEIRCWAGEPPPSCKLVEEEIDVPAQPARKEKRMKLVCKEEGK